MAFTLWETLERQIVKCNDSQDVSKAILQIPKKQRFRLFQRAFPSCWISVSLPLLITVSETRGRSPDRKESIAHGVSSPLCPSHALGLPALTPALPFLIYPGRPLGPPTSRGSWSCKPTSPFPWAARGGGCLGTVLTYTAQRKGKAGVLWDTCQDSSRTDTQSLCCCSRCSG